MQVYNYNGQIKVHALVKQKLKKGVNELSLYLLYTSS